MSGRQGLAGAAGPEHEPESVADPGDLPSVADVVVVGLGLMGAAAAWALARRGHAVLALDARPPGHTHGSSHGGSRIVRRAYAHEHYVAMTGAAWDGWLELEELSGRRLLTVTGGIDRGPAAELAGLRRALAGADVESSMLSAPEARERWPHMRFDEPVLHHAQAGVVNPEVGVAAMSRLAEEASADVRRGIAVAGIEPDGERVRVRTPAGTVRARRVVAAAGPWTAELLGGVVPLPALTVTQQQVFFFPRRESGPGADAVWPVVLDRGRPVVYALPGGRDGGPRPTFKIGDHTPGRVTTASTRDGMVDPVARSLMVRRVREWWPGLEPDPSAEASCLYTWTRTEDFFLGEYGPLLVLSPCSGHGAKFAPLVGRWAADLVEGGRLPYPIFGRAAHGAG